MGDSTRSGLPWALATHMRFHGHPSLLAWLLSPLQMASTEPLPRPRVICVPLPSVTLSAMLRIMPTKST